MVKVIGAGFPRTGTLSTRVALETLGYGPCYHFVSQLERPDDTDTWYDAACGRNIFVMIAAVVIALFIMIAASGGISAFVEKHPTVKMLALSFLLLIGFVLVAEGCGQHIPKGYIYFAMAFSIAVEMLNLRLRKGSAPVHLRQ